VIKEVFVGVTSVAGFVGAVLIGMQIEQRLSAADSEKSEATAFERGLRQAESNYKAAEGPMTVFARQLRGVLGSNEASANLPSPFIEKLDGALLKAENGDFTAAAAALPKGVALANKERCLDLNAGDLVLKKGQTFDTCEFGNFVAVRDAYFNGRLQLVVDGENTDVQLFKRAQFNPQCIIHFLKTEKNGQDSVSTVRFICSPK
jgi:hypothetical protein